MCDAQLPGIWAAIRRIALPYIRSMKRGLRLCCHCVFFRQLCSY